MLKGVQKSSGPAIKILGSLTVMLSGCSLFNVPTEDWATPDTFESASCMCGICRETPFGFEPLSA